MNTSPENYELQVRKSVKLFWNRRKTALTRNLKASHTNMGSRGAVTTGKNMDGFVTLIQDLTQASHLKKDIKVCTQKRTLTLPGFFRPAKLWDMLIMHNNQLIAALELKSQVGPSFGNNFNNRSEEAIGTAYDFWATYNKGGFGKKIPKPFLAWIMLLEDCTETHRPVSNQQPHFPVNSIFQSSSYAKRYDILCKQLMSDKLYTSTALLLSPKEAANTGTFHDVSDATSIYTFITAFLNHITNMEEKLSEL